MTKGTVTAPRIIVPRATYAITRRTLFRKLFLTPLTPVVHEGLLYALGLALQDKEVLLHSSVIVPNHVHFHATPTKDNLPEFLRFYFCETSKFIKVALAEHGFEPPEDVWNKNRPHLMRLVDEGAQLAWLHYTVANVVHAGLVEKFQEYPGHVSDPGLMAGGTIVVKRPPFYFDPRENPEEVVIHYCPPPLLRKAFGSTAPIIHHVRKAVKATESACKKRRGTVLGALAVTRQHPWSEPRSPRTFKQGPTPSFMVAGSKSLRILCAEETATFRLEHEEARLKRLNGEEHEFPYGTYAMRVFHDAPIQDPSTLGEAVINAPGSLEIDDGPVISKAALYRLTGELKKAALEVSAAEDILAQRIVDGKAANIDRRAGPPIVTAMQQESDEDMPSPRAPALSKVVVLRGSTKTARERRQRSKVLVPTKHKDPRSHPPDQ